MSDYIKEYQETGAIRCKECGLNTVETDFCTPYCPRIDCKGVMLNEKELNQNKDE